MLKVIRNNAFARNSLILFAGSMVANILGYLFHLAIGRMVSIETYGEVESLISLLSIISIPAAALGMIATKYSASSKAENDFGSSLKLIKYLNKKVFTYGLPIFILALILTPVARNFLKIEGNTAIIILWLMMFLSFFASVTGGVLNGWQKFKESSYAGILGGIAKLIFGIFFVKLGFSLNGIIGSFALGVFFSYLVTFYFLRFVFKNSQENIGSEKNIINLKSVRSYALPALFGNLAITILGNADMVLAKHNLDPATAGQYGALTIVSKIIFFATGTIATVLFSMSAEDSHNNKDSLRILRNATFLMLAISIFSVIVYFLFPKLILSLLFGNKYNSVAHYLGWFAILVTFFSLVNLISQYMLSIHKTRFVYGLLAISLLSIISILFMGKSISAIIGIMITTQILAIIGSLFFLVSNKKQYE